MLSSRSASTTHPKVWGYQTCLTLCWYFLGLPRPAYQAGLVIASLARARSGTVAEILTVSHSLWRIVQLPRGLGVVASLGS